MTSRSEISACPPLPPQCLVTSRHFVTVSESDLLLPQGAAQGTCVTSDARSYLFLSLCLSFSFAPVFLRRETPSWSYYMPKLVSVCVCVQSIFAEAAAVHLLDGFSAFPLFTVLSTLYWFTNMFFMAF